VTEIQELREIVQAQARKITTLTNLVERMGHDLAVQLWGDAGWAGGYTMADQRQLEAEAHEAEGEPEGHELVEDVQ